MAKAEPAVSDLTMLELPERKLRLLMEIDDLRDAAEDPDDVLGAIVDVMARGLAAEVCLLFVMDPASGESELRAVRDRSGKLSRMSAEDLADLSRSALEATAVEIRQGPDVQSALGWDAEDLQLAVVPIVMGESDRLGTLVLCRASKPFQPSDVDLLVFAESQLDSALVQARRLYELDLRNRELETIYRVDRIRDARLSFDEMLDRVLHELRSVIRADMSFIMLYDRAGKQLELRATSQEDLASRWSSTHQIETAANQAVEVGELVVRDDLEGAYGSVMCVPLILRDEVLGVFGMAGRGPKSFKEGERRILSAIASQMDTAIFESLEQGRLRQVLGRSVDPHVMERLLDKSEVGFLKGERQVLTVLYADLRGSTHLAETTDPEHLVEFINDFLGSMAEVILRHEGTLDKFVGDEVMALFGAPFPMEGHALRAVRVGLEMQEIHREVMERWIARGVEACPLGVGIATGELIVGEMGSAQRSDYSVLGLVANLGSRICGVAQAGQVLVSSDTHAIVGDQVEAKAITGLHFKGFAEDVTVFDVTGLV